MRAHRHISQWIFLTLFFALSVPALAERGHGASTKSGGDFFGGKSGELFKGNGDDFFKKSKQDGAPGDKEFLNLMPSRCAYDPPTANGVVRPGGGEAYDPPTANGVTRPGGYTSYDPNTANGVVRPGGVKMYAR